jgi:proteasome lid subunit RPN8/RPN11
MSRHVYPSMEIEPVDSIDETMVSKSLVTQAMDFTAPRGRLEMGGLLIGHIDQKGAINVVTGFFPEQLKETPGYCRFSGSWVAVAASACEYANSFSSSEGVPDLRIVGWIHTHPDLGLFLSSTDVDTYSTLRGMVPDYRFVAVVIDPLRGQDGVFPSERLPNTFFPASGEPGLDERLRDRYHHLLDRLQEVRRSVGTDRLPSILPGDLRGERLARGDADDSVSALRESVHFLKAELWKSEDKVSSLVSEIETAKRGLLEEIRRLDRRVESLERNKGQGIMAWFTNQ